MVQLVFINFSATIFMLYLQAKIKQVLPSASIKFNLPNLLSIKKSAIMGKFFLQAQYNSISFDKL